MLVPLLPQRWIDRLVHICFGRFVRRFLSLRENNLAQRALFSTLTYLLYGAYLRRIRACRYVFFQAEGTMDGKGAMFPSGGRLLLLPYAVSVLLGKPLLSLNQTIFSVDPEFASMLKNCFNTFDMVSVREPASYRHARELGITKTTLCPDAAFAAEPSNAPLEELLDRVPAGDFFCVTGSMALHMPRWDDYIQTIRRTAVEHGLEVVFVCSTLADIAFSVEARSRLRDLKVSAAKPDASYRDVAKIISKSKLLLGGRYHLAILAATTRTPFVLLPSSTHKTAGLIELLDYPLRVRRFDESDGLREDIGRALREHASLSEHLKKKMQEIKLTRARELEALKDFLRKPFKKAARGRKMDLNQENNSTRPNRHPVIFRCLSEYRQKVFQGESAAKVLSFGCSSGEEALALSRAIPSARIYGCDVHAPSLKKAARLCGDAATIFESSQEQLLLRGPFHLICCMNVLCRHPIGKNKFSELYPFSVFEQTLETLDAALHPGGVMALYNTQYPAEACGVMKRYEPVPFPALGNNGWLDKYSPDGVRRLANGKLFLDGSWLPHADWLKAPRHASSNLVDPAAGPIRFEGGRPQSSIDTSTVFWRKLRGTS